ncbi:unnamed protein product [Arctia plantaginis]|uniref:Uncharacterized protein n=1 Tax=Arctia plantaginis TaxID=874455 RepID=A0A8S1BJH0_ARCPL|nr:unnamed protein product [Arctia plantaginis]
MQVKQSLYYGLDRYELLQLVMMEKVARRREVKKRFYYVTEITDADDVFRLAKNKKEDAKLTADQMLFEKKKEEVKV